MATKKNSNADATATKAGLDEVLNFIKKQYTDMYDVIKSHKFNVAEEERMYEYHVLKGNSNYWFFATDVFLQQDKENLGKYLDNTLDTYCYKNQQAYFELIISLYVMRKFYSNNDVADNVGIIDDYLNITLDIDTYTECMEYDIENSDYSDYAMFIHVMREFNDKFKIIV